MDPTDVFNYAWEIQGKAQKLQAEFDEAYLKASALISKTLGEESLNTLSDYDGHTKEVLKLYEPVFDDLAVIPVGDCRTHAQSMLSSIIGTSGSAAGVCVRNYHTFVKAAADEAVDHIYDLNADYLKLSRFVYQAFPSRNALTQSQNIEININATWYELSNRLTIDPIDTEAFEAELAKLSETFNNCLASAERTVVNMLPFVKNAIEVCKDIHDIPRANGRVAIGGLSTIMSQFDEALKNQVPFQW